MFIVLCVLNNHYLVGYYHTGSRNKFTQETRALFRPLGYSTRFGNDLLKFKRYICRQISNRKDFERLLRKSDEDLLKMLETQPKQFETEQAALAFLDEHPPYKIPKEFCVVIEE